MSQPRNVILKRLLVAPPILLGIGALVFAISGREAPEQAAPGETARPVRVIEVQPTDFVPRALGYGHVEPGAIWEALAEVSGTIVYRHPELESGRVMPAGSELLRIDPTDYELALSRIRADRQSVEAELSELEVRRANTEGSLTIERRSLALAGEDLDRKKALRQRGNASQATVDQAETAVLSQRQRVQELDNTLNLIPAERAVLQARLAQVEVQLREAKRDLERTKIVLPFDARIAAVPVERAQFVSVGKMMVEAHSIDVAEISAQMPLAELRRLVPRRGDDAVFDVEALRQLPRSFGFAAEVRLGIGDLLATWEARFDRAAQNLDPETRTIGMIVAVDDPYRRAQPGKRPPLIKDMYVEVELRAPPLESQIVVPRTAVHAGDDGGQLVYLVDENDRLVRRPIVVGAAQGDIAVIEAGLDPGERVLVSDLIPAIDGMLLAPTHDDRLERRLLAQSSGGGTAESASDDKAEP